MPVTGEHFFQTSDGARLYFEEHGGGSGSPLLMVPGFLCTTRFFQRNLGPLSRGRRVVAIDPRGQGLSSKTLCGNTVARNARDLAELIEALDLKNLVLLGWSVGSSVALQYAARLDRGRLAGLILVDGSLFPLSGESWNKHRARDCNVQSWMDTYLPLYYDPQEFHRRFLERISNGRMSPEDREWILAECRRTLPWTALELHYDFCHTDSLSCLPALRVPVAFFGGDSEAYGLEMLNEYAGRVNVPAQVQPFYESGHLMFYYEAEKFNRLVAAFCDGLPAAGAPSPAAGGSA